MKISEWLRLIKEKGLILNEKDYITRMVKEDYDLEIPWYWIQEFKTRSYVGPRNKRWWKHFINYLHYPVSGEI